jgi:hypothetical protein
MQERIVAGYIGRLVLAGLLLCLAQSTAQAWGAKGHRIVGLMARDLLSPTARTAVKQLMGSDDLATFALYLDQHKDDLERRIPGSREWHYDDVPICGDKSYDEYCPNGTCASTQIVRYYGVLVDIHASKQQKQFAIFVLTHLLGDMHQPLHAADNDDRGGNEIKVRLPDGRSMNLHAAWDTSFVERRFGGQNEMTVAKALEQKFAARATEWQAGRVTLVTMQAWVEESDKLAKDVAYGKLLPTPVCEADLERARITLSEEYVQQAGPIVEEQLAKGGYRLAYILNRALGD